MDEKDNNVSQPIPENQKLLVIGGTGYCGRAFVELILSDESFVRPFGGVVHLLVRDEARAREQLKGREGLNEKRLTSRIRFLTGDVYDPNSIQRAVEGVTCIVSYVSSYQPPHTQMSALVETLVHKCDYSGRYIHFGYPRGYGSHGTAIEHAILAMVERVSFRKYGPAIRDHELVRGLLESGKCQMDYCIFAAPNMVEEKRKRNREYFGSNTASVNMAIAKSRVWQSVSTADAADLILNHLLNAKEPLPRLVCLAYK